MLLRDTKGLSSCTEKAAVRPLGLSRIPAPVPCLFRCRKPRPVPHSEILNVSTRKYDGLDIGYWLLIQMRKLFALR